MESLAALSLDDDKKSEISSKSKFSSNEDGEFGSRDFESENKEKERNDNLAIVEDERAKVFELLKVLEEYRTKSEEDGNYTEAAKTHKQLNILRKQEEKRQLSIVASKHKAEQVDLSIAHQQQLDEFNIAWDQYMFDYESMAAQYIQNLNNRHMADMLNIDSEIHDTLVEKQPRFSKELTDQRRRQHAAARNHHYREAEQLKRECDSMEETELGLMREDQGATLSHRQNKLRKQHQVELQALLARIDGRRAEHIKKRAADCKRLMQRNKNIHAALESRQTVEAQKLAEETRKSLQLTCEPALSGNLSGVSSTNAKSSSTSMNQHVNANVSGAPRRAPSSSSSRDGQTGRNMPISIENPHNRTIVTRPSNGSDRGTSPRTGPNPPVNLRSTNTNNLVNPPKTKSQSMSAVTSKISPQAGKTVIGRTLASSAAIGATIHQSTVKNQVDYASTNPMIIKHPISQHSTDLSFLNDTGPTFEES